MGTAKFFFSATSDVEPVTQEAYVGESSPADAEQKKQKNNETFNS